MYCLCLPARSSHCSLLSEPSRMYDLFLKILTCFFASTCQSLDGLNGYLFTNVGELYYRERSFLLLAVQPDGPFREHFCKKKLFSWPQMKLTKNGFNKFSSMHKSTFFTYLRGVKLKQLLLVSNQCANWENEIELETIGISPQGLQISGNPDC